MSQKIYNMEFYGEIYIAINKISGKAYIGKALNYKQRKNRHIYNAKHNLYDCHFYRAISKYGKENFIWGILDVDFFSEENLYQKEKYYIQFFDTYDNGYNENCGGVGQLKYKQSAETINKRIAKTTGKKRSLEQKQNISLSLKGKHKSKEHKDNISKSQLGIKNNNFNKIYTDEEKQKLKMAQPNKKKIICLNTNIIYDTINDAARDLKLQRTLISAVLSGRRRHTQNYIFKFI